MKEIIILMTIIGLCLANNNVNKAFAHQHKQKHTRELKNLADGTGTKPKELLPLTSQPNEPETKSNDEKDQTEPGFSVEHAKLLVSCDTYVHHCEKIESFVVNDTNYKCEHKYLEISFKSQKGIIRAFVEQIKRCGNDLMYNIKKEREIQKNCQLIKRY
jgi:hypothetical protein